MNRTSIRHALLGLPPRGLRIQHVVPAADPDDDPAGGCKWHGPHDEGPCPRCERMRELRAKAPTQVRTAETGSRRGWRAAGSGTGA